jgi:1,4-alpha-glucan branching enzyme
LPTTAFVNFVQNHDQVGNHAYGWRLSKFAKPGAARLGAVLLLLSPSIPLLFMGEEWASEAAFPFFCDFKGELADAVRNGRLGEFGAFPEFADPAARAGIPDPLAEATFLSAKLDWHSIDTENHRAMLEHYRQLIALRRRHIMPLLASGGAPEGRFERFGETGLKVSWRLASQELRLLANFSSEPAAAALPQQGTIIYRSHHSASPLPPWFVAVDLVAAGAS